ncbi:hypothetical protein ACQ4N7_24820 [Nodosilinea sp. AN01ver1]|uniref:hypothetical protein n=1 Tax=Nodosilinea sp. AN01ver1 TaxID=3423362 RepID=UPI003D3172F5
MTESSTSDKTKSTPTTTRSKASSSEAEAAPEATAAAPEPEADPSDCFPLFVRKLKGFGAALESIQAARKEAKLPSLNPTDYRVIPGRPGGIPFSFPVQVVYRPGDPKERNLGTFRVGR